jgi:hypothetical protein
MKAKTATETENPRPGPQRNRPGDRRLTGEEIGLLAKRMVESNDSHEKAMLKEAIARGFYGDPSDA